MCVCVAGVGRRNVHSKKREEESHGALDQVTLTLLDCRAGRGEGGGVGVSQRREAVT